MSIGDNIKKCRGNMSQEELAEKIGVNVATLSRWENNKNAPNSKNVQLLAEILNVSPEQIINTSEPQIKELNERSDYGIMRYKFSDTEVLELPATSEFIPIFTQIILQRLKFHD